MNFELYKNILNEMIFGIEIESCINLSNNFVIPFKINSNKTKSFLEKLTYYYNELINDNKIPIILNNPKYIFSNNTLYHNSDSGKNWTIQEDLSIICDNDVIPLLPVEIVTPKLTLNNIIYEEPNEIYKRLQQEDDYFYEGIFNLYNYYYFLFNNEYNENKIKLYKNISQGLHVHISNKNVKFSNSNGLHFLHFYRMFYLFEPLLFNLVDDERISSTYCTPINTKDINFEGMNNLMTQELVKKFINIKNPTVNILDFLQLYIKYFSHRSNSINIQHINKLKLDYIKNYNEPFHFEIRLHHGSSDIAEIINWTFLLILFYNTCIYEINILEDEYNKNINPKSFFYIQPFNKELLYDNNINAYIFNLFFDRFIKNDILKKYYYNKISSKFKFKLNKVPYNFKLHSNSKFNEDGTIIVSNLLQTELKNILYINNHTINSIIYYLNYTNRNINYFTLKQFYLYDNIEKFFNNELNNYNIKLYIYKIKETAELYINLYDILKQFNIFILIKNKIKKYINKFIDKSQLNYVKEMDFKKILFENKNQQSKLQSTLEPLQIEHKKLQDKINSQNLFLELYKSQLNSFKEDYNKIINDIYENENKLQNLEKQIQQNKKQLNNLIIEYQNNYLKNQLQYIYKFNIKKNNKNINQIEQVKIPFLINLFNIHKDWISKLYLKQTNNTNSVNNLLNINKQNIIKILNIIDNFNKLDIISKFTEINNYKHLITNINLDLII